jgi:hypothetical protein
MTFEEWKAECAVLAEQLLGLGDVLAKDDPYEVLGLMPGAYKIGKAPEAFIRHVFEGDFARMAHDDHLAEEALQYVGPPEE